MKGEKLCHPRGARSGHAALSHGEEPDRVARAPSQDATLERLFLDWPKKHLCHPR